MHRENRHSSIYILSAVFFWSTVATVFKLTLEGMSFAQLLFYSSAISTIFMFVFITYSKDRSIKSVFSSESIKKSLLLGFLNPFFYYIVLFKAYSLLPAQEAQPLNYTWPIAISIFSIIFLKQKINANTVVGIVSAFIGVNIITTKGDFSNLQLDSLLGINLALSSSLIWASFWILNLLDNRENAVKLAGAFLLGTIYSAIYIFFFDSFTIENPVNLFGAAYVGIFEMGITFFLWNKGLELSTDKVKTSTLAYLAPFISLVFIALILEEKILPSSIIGLVFIVGGILYQNLKAVKQS